MARTQAPDYDKKREVITSHAAHLFADCGFAGASISKLSAMCGISKSLIYHYYNSKEAILFDVMRDHVDELVQIVSVETDPSMSAEQTFRSLTRALVRCYVGAQDKQKVLLYEMGHLSDTQKSDIIGKQRVLVSKFEQVIGAALLQHGGDAAKIRAKVMLFFGMINWTHTWYKPSGSLSRDDIADMAVDTILGF